MRSPLGSFYPYAPALYLCLMCAAVLEHGKSLPCIMVIYIKHYGSLFVLVTTSCPPRLPAFFLNNYTLWCVLTFSRALENYTRVFGSNSWMTGLSSLSEQEILERDQPSHLSASHNNTSRGRMRFWLQNERRLFCVVAFHTIILWKVKKLACLLELQLERTIHNKIIQARASKFKLKGFY